MPITVDACVAQHQGDRKEQQDRVAIFAHPRAKGTALAIVADGMGGHTGGALAAEQVVHSCKTSFEQSNASQENPYGLLESCLLEAHTMIKASRCLNEKDPHSTAVVLLLQPGRITWAHCGDSRLYHFHGAELVRRTVDHSYVEHLVSIGSITAEQALTHPNRNVLITSLGGKDQPKIDLGDESHINGGDNFILCSDGLWAYFDEEEMGFILATHTAREACEKLIELARERADGEGDNVSLIVIRLLEVEVPRPGFRSGASRA